MKNIERSLTFFKYVNSGRVAGQIACRTKGSGSFRLYRFLDFSLIFSYIFQFIVLFSEKDSYRNGFIAMVLYPNGVLSFRLLASNMFAGDVVFPMTPLGGSTYSVGDIYKEGLHVFCLTSKNFAKYSRAAGTSSVFLSKGSLLALIKLPSGSKKLFSLKDFCIFGSVSHAFHRKLVIGKAGFRRRWNFRPIVRGIAKNPVDHPNGGRTPGGKVYRSFSNKIARSSKRTRRKSL